MSYDTYMTIDTGGTEPAEVEEIGNYTSNVAWMWHRSISAAKGADLTGYADRGAPVALYDLAGQTGEELLPVLDRALAYMQENRASFTENEPENGWGDFAGAVQYLQDIREACARHPKAQLHVSH